MGDFLLMKKITTSFFILTLAGLVTFVGPNWSFAFMASAMIGLALSEFFSLAEKKGIFVYKYFGVIVGMCVPIMVYFQKGMEGYFALEPFFIVIACLFIFVLQFIRLSLIHI